MTACAQVETELGRHAAARRRLLAALAGAAPDSRPGLAFQLAAAEFQEGRARRLRDRSRAAVRATAQADDRLLLAGAEALDALGALWNGDVAAAHAALDRATAGLDAHRRRAVPGRRASDALVYVSVAQVLLKRALRRRRGDERRARSRSSAGPGTLKCSAPALGDGSSDGAAEAARTRRGGTLVESAQEVARLQRSSRLLCFALWLGAVVDHERGLYPRRRARR